MPLPDPDDEPDEQAASKAADTAAIATAATRLRDAFDLVYRVACSDIFLPFVFTAMLTVRAMVT